MTTCLGKSCSFGLTRVPFVSYCQFMYLVISLLVLRAGCRIWLYQFLIIGYLFALHIQLLFELYLNIPYFYYISTRIMRSFFHTDVSLMEFHCKIPCATTTSIWLKPHLPRLYLAQEVSSKKIIVDNRALLSLKGSTWPETRRQWLNGGGAKCHTNLDLNDNRWDRNDGPKLSGVQNALVFFGKSWYRLSSA